MSTKIFVAYRLKQPDQLWPLVRDIHRQGKVEVDRCLRKFYDVLLKGVDVESEGYQKALESRLKYSITSGDGEKAMAYERELAKLDVAAKVIRRGYRMSSTNPQRSYFNFNVCVTFREHEGSIYLIPYCEGFMADALDFLAKDPRLVDYHYQNCTDPPEDVDPKEWDERAKVWDYLTDHERWSEFLVADICSWDKWWQVDPHYELHRELHERTFR